MPNNLFTIKRGDRRPSIKATLSRVDGSVVNLTGAVVLFKMQTPVVLSAVATIVSATGPATVQYDWLAPDTATSGSFRAEWEVTYADGTKESFPNGGYMLVQILDDI